MRSRLPPNGTGSRDLTSVHYHCFPICRPGQVSDDDDDDDDDGMVDDDDDDDEGDASFSHAAFFHEMEATQDGGVSSLS